MVTHRRKWRLAGHMARRTDGRWSETMLGWQPLYSHRGRGHPAKRWTTDVDAYFYHLEGAPFRLWSEIAHDTIGGMHWRRALSKEPCSNNEIVGLKASVTAQHCGSQIAAHCWFFHRGGFRFHRRLANNTEAVSMFMSNGKIIAVSGN